MYKRTHPRRWAALSNLFPRTQGCLSNITASRQRRETFAEQRTGLIKNSLLVTRCLFSSLQKEGLSEVAGVNCAPLAARSGVEKKTKDVETGWKWHVRGGGNFTVGQIGAMKGRRGQLWSGVGLTRRGEE